MPAYDTAMDHDLVVAAEAIQPRTVELRRELHRYPEVGNDLPKTRTIVLDAISDLGLDIELHQSTSGIVATLNGESPGPTILLRGDMDGLAMPEDTGLEYASEHELTMHACGHDLHTAMLVGAASVLSQRRDRLAGRVVFMFQPGEEGHFGARLMLDEGLLETAPTPSGAFAIHVTTMYASGTVNHRRGPQLASADEFHVTLTGRGGHASAPHLAADPIPAAAEIILATQSAVTRRFSVFDPVVVTYATLSAGTAQNVIPETVELGGTIRALSPDARAQAHGMIERIAASVAAGHGLESSLDLRPGYPVTLNDGGFVEFVDDVVAAVLGPDRLQPMPDPIMGAEDWSYVLDRVPGMMTFLGACPPDLTPGDAPNNHSNRVRFDEDSMVSGVALYAGVAERFLET